MDMKVNSGASSMTQLLADMKNLRDRAIKNSAIPGSDFTEALNKAQQSSVPDFSNLLNNAINQVNDLQQESGAMKKSYELGDPEVDITQVMVASQKATIAFEAMKQVRNKLVDAYRDVMNMPI